MNQQCLGRLQVWAYLVWLALCVRVEKMHFGIQALPLATVSLENCRAGLRALRESVYRWGPSWDEATLRQFPVPCPEASSGQTGSCGEDEVSYSTIVCEGRPGLCSHHRSHVPALLATLSRPVLLWAPCSSSVKWACTLLILFLVWRSIRVNGCVVQSKISQPDSLGRLSPPGELMGTKLS